MKTKTHYLYSFIIVSLLVALVITSVSKPTPKRIETTPPVEITTEMVTLPPSDTDDTNENEEKIYDDTYYTVATYFFFFYFIGFWTVLTRYPFWVVQKNFPQIGIILLIVLLSFLSTVVFLIIYILSMVRDTLHVNQYIILSFYLLSIFFVGPSLVFVAKQINQLQ